jgi:hypothetical protein
VLECVIPKGAAYYVGRFTFLRDAVAADTMGYTCVVAYKKTIMSETKSLGKKNTKKVKGILKSLAREGLL